MTYRTSPPSQPTLLGADWRHCPATFPWLGSLPHDLRLFDDPERVTPLGGGMKISSAFSVVPLW